MIVSLERQQVQPRGGIGPSIRLKAEAFRLQSLSFSPPAAVPAKVRRRREASTEAWQRLQSSLEGFARAVQESVETSPLVHMPFLLALPLCLALFGWLGPLNPGQAGIPSHISFVLPEDALLPQLLLHLDDPEALFSPAVPLEAPAGNEARVSRLLEGLKVTEYTVQPGDSLSTIAARSGLTLGTLINFNGISNARRIQTGMVLKVPNMDGVLHTVARGESLSAIAQRTRVAYDDILDANNLESAVLQPGQKLFLPGAQINNFELRQALGELFIYPVRGRLTSAYGYRRDPFTGVRRFHAGIDLAGPVGTPIRASMEGRVADVGFHSVYGNYVVINHDGGYQTLYAHLQTYSVAKGQRVAQGARIGAMGSTGYSTGSHLHFSIFRRNQHVDPLRLLN